MYNGFLNILHRDEEIVFDSSSRILGPILLGVIVNYFLWGIQIVQSYHYYKCYRKTDGTWLKVAVGLLFVADAIQSICASEDAWHVLVAAWGNVTDIQRLDWGISILAFMDAFTASIVHIFYAQKIWTLLDIPYNYIFTTIVLSLSCLQLVAGLGWTVFVFCVALTMPDLYRIKTWSSVWLVTASITDIIITGIITWKLSNSRTGYKDTDDIISKLLRLIIETGLATAIVQVLNIGLYLRWPLENYDLFPALVSAKMYSNSMSALLNSRRSRDTSDILNSHNGQTAETTLHFRTTQSVDVTSRNDRFETKTVSLRSRNEVRVAPDAERFSSLPFGIVGSAKMQGGIFNNEPASGT